jgi:flagellar biosynthesis/type III secretory pathway chaperone
MPAINIIHIITAMAALSELIAQANNALGQSARLLKQAQDEGRDITDAELQSVQEQRKSAVQKFRELG